MAVFHWTAGFPYARKVSFGAKPEAADTRMSFCSAPLGATHFLALPDGAKGASCNCLAQTTSVAVPMLGTGQRAHRSAGT